MASDEMVDPLEPGSLRIRKKERKKDLAHSAVPFRGTMSYPHGPRLVSECPLDF
jgi:hypothetical protein